ncbi:MAG TPA: hypothetical protein VMW52_05330 [Phycisphaerae bacterium]|nr:hypothetical protein [Phycisphaerae bacterium]
MTETLFDDLPYEAQRDCAVEIARFAGQVARIWDRLCRGPATNAELAAISRKYTGRISELRRAIHRHGYDILCYDHDHRTGVSWYRLVTLERR